MTAACSSAVIALLPSLRILGHARLRGAAKEANRDRELDCEVGASNERTVSVGMNNGEKIFTRGLHHRFVANRIVRLAAETSRAASLGGRNSMRSQLVHDGLPGSLRHSWIMCGEIRASGIEIERCFAMGFVHSI